MSPDRNGESYFTDHRIHRGLNGQALANAYPPDDPTAPEDAMEDGANDALPTELEPDIFDEIIASQRR